MKKRIGAALAAVALLALWSCSPGLDQAPSTAPLAGALAGRNLLLISVDTVRADRLGAYGHTVLGSSPTPRIDALMGLGVRFARATAPRATTWPSLASVLTGLYPSGHGVAENGYRFPDDVPTLPNLLQGAGYRTGRFLSNMCNANHTGWDEAFCSRGVDQHLNPRVFAWLDGLEGPKPVFLWVHYFGAHSPYYNGGDRARKRLDPSYDGFLLPKKRILNSIMRERTPLGERDLRHLDAIYDAAVMGTDRFVGRLLDGLAERGLIDSSLIVFLSDHGEDLYDHHGYIYHACSVYETGLQVPLAVVAPGVLAPAQLVRQNAELLDVAPTVLELLAIAPPSEQHGVSLVPYLARPTATGRGKPAFSEFGETRLHTVVDGDWKLIDNPDHFSPYCLEGAPEDHYPLAPVELYNLADDPLESRNLASQHPQRVSELQELIRRRFAELPRRLAPQEIPEELREELRALGYIAN